MYCSVLHCTIPSVQFFNVLFCTALYHTVCTVSAALRLRVVVQHSTVPYSTCSLSSMYCRSNGMALVWCLRR